VADAYVYQESPTENYGSDSDLHVGYNWDLPGYDVWARSFIRFDLSSLPSGAAVEDAALLVYSGDDVIPTISVTQVLAEWVEMEINWDNQPTTLWPQVLAPAVVAGSSGDYSWDVTSLVQDWVDGASDNDGLVLIGKEGTEPSDWYTLSSRESSEPPPRLRVQYVTVP
jgi:hypothetical protein